MTAARATLTLIPDGDELKLLTEYEGGFDFHNGAHVMAIALGEHLSTLLEAKTAVTDLTPEEIAQVKQTLAPAGA